MPKFIRLNVHGLVHTDVNKDVKSYWVPKDIIGNIPIDFEDVGITYRVGHIVKAIPTLLSTTIMMPKEKEVLLLVCFFLPITENEMILY